MALPISLYWFRQDLRLADNPALTAAAQAGTVIPVFILMMTMLASIRWAVPADGGCIIR